MADKYMGNPAVNQNNQWAGTVTFVLLEVPAPCNGKLYKVQIYNDYRAGDIKIKTWRDDGNNYVQLSSETVTLTTNGLHTFTLVTPVLIRKGDFIGGTTTVAMAGAIDLVTTGGNSVYIGSDVGTTAKASFTATAYLISMYGFIKHPSGFMFFM